MPARKPPYTLSAQTQTTQLQTIRPFQFHASEQALTDLKQRIQSTKWPNQELVEDGTQGVQLATMQKLADYCAENSHVPLRKRERIMQRFRSVGGLQRFIAVFSAVRNVFVPPHQKRSALATHIHRIRALAQWKAVTGATA